MKSKTKELEKAFNKLKKRIIRHRKKCYDWERLEPCFNCHVNTLTKIEKEIEKLRWNS